jgi:alpha-mannosidase
VKKGQEFGPNWSNHWFKVTVKIPAEWKDYERVVFDFDCSGEAMVFDTEGNPYQGLTCTDGHDRRVDFVIPAEHREAGVGHYWIESSCNGMFGCNDEMFGEMDGTDEKPAKKWTLRSYDLVVPNMEAERAMWDFNCLRELYEKLPSDSALGQRARWTANEMINAFQRGDLESIVAARKVAEKVFGENWEEQIKESSKEPKKQQGGTLWALGHCHIDTAWLWPFSVTQQKSARSWSTQCDLIDRYPEYTFTATTPQQYKWLEQLYPSLFKRIQDKAKEGRFQPLGCSWVEMDVNMPSGESLVRQFLYGQRFFESRFGKRSQTFVLPDTFGYSSQLPQISRLSGAPNFFTQKISWNNINKFPHSTFNWAGLDGSIVLTHMTPVDSYNASCSIEELQRAINNHKNIDVTKHALLLFGHGDGGGGPTAPMIERLRRTRAMCENREDATAHIPQIKNAGSFEEFYDAVRDETENGALLPTWRGELYLEIHRATYTSQAAIKKGNRKSEVLLREAEYTATMASILDSSYVYPKEALQSAWEDLLLCQFHDVLPGSSIPEVYVDAHEIYARLHDNVSKIINDAYDVLYPGTKVLEAGATASTDNLVAFNSITGHARQEVVKVGNEYVAVRAEASGDIARVTKIDAPAPKAEQVGDNEYELSNASIKVKFSGGRLTSIVDLKLNKELIPAGQTGGLVIMEDQPNYWDAWDADHFHLEKQKHLTSTVKVGENTALRSSLIVTTIYDKSSITLEVSLDAIPASIKADARSLIRLDAKADWHQKHEFLKFELPLNVHADNAVYDTQFGILSRPTHRNTSWDAAKFEVCAHKFADLSEWGYGVAIINDCKYGYATVGNVMTLSLLRGPRVPDPDTDMGKHEFSFAIYPHANSFGESDVPTVATAFNNPLRVRTGGADPDKWAFATPFSISGASNVTLETIKRGEDDSTSGPKTVIVRLFEQFGGHANATFKVEGVKVAKAEVVNLLEDNLEDLQLATADNATTVNLPFRGFEIKTVRLTLA